MQQGVTSRILVQIEQVALSCEGNATALPAYSARPLCPSRIDAGVTTIQTRRPRHCSPYRSSSRAPDFTVTERRPNATPVLSSGEPRWCCRARALTFQSQHPTTNYRRRRLNKNLQPFQRWSSAVTLLTSHDYLTFFKKGRLIMSLRQSH